MIPERFRTIWGTRTFSTPCATRRWRRTDLKTSGRIKCSAGYGVGSEILRKSKCKNHRNNACKVTDISREYPVSLMMHWRKGCRGGVCSTAPGEPMPPEKRIALVIGNGGYKEAPLVNPLNDAKAM